MRRFRRGFAKISAFAGFAAAAYHRRALYSAWAIVLFERFWRRFTPFLLLLLSFAACCWLNIFIWLPLVLHALLLAVFAAAFAASLALLYFLPWPRGAEARARLERDNQLGSGRLSLDSQKPAGNIAPETAALWRAHQQRMQVPLDSLALRPPRPNLPLYDRHGLRAAVFLIFAVAFCFRLGGSGGRLGDAFYFGGGRLDAPLRIDAWINPPDYSGRPPVYLLSARGFDDSGALPPALAAPINLPQGSVLMLRVGDSGRGLARLACASAAGAMRPQRQKEGENSFYQLRLMQSAACALSAPGLKRSWQLAIAPDKAPIISWAAPPERALNGVLKLHYRIYDDYGIKKAWAEIAPALANAPDSLPYPYFARLTAAQALAAPPKTEQLAPPPQISLNLPRLLPDKSGAWRGGAAETEADLSKNPWAGAAVIIRLGALDAAGHKAFSAPLPLVLPQKIFINPLSRALIEQRRLLTENTAAEPQIADMLQALLLWPEKTIADKGAALALYSLQARLKLPLPEAAAGEPAAGKTARARRLGDIADYMWAIAEGLDSGKLAEAEKRLRQAGQALRDALRNGAGAAEIARLMQNLREAMEDYIAMLAERGQIQDDNAPKPPMLGEGDLEKKLKALEEAAKQGNRGLGEQLLSEFETLMKNLQVMQGGQGKSINGGKNSKQSQMQQQLDSLSDIMRRQQQLLDDTHKLREQMLRQQDGQESQSGGKGGQKGKGGEQSGQNQGGERGENSDALRQALPQRQSALQQDLRNLQKQLEEQGLAPKGGLQGAERQMGGSAEALRQGDAGAAQENQAQALQALRDGAQGLMEQMRAALAAAEAARQKEANGQSGGQPQAEAGGGKGQDPLGRPAGSGQNSQDGQGAFAPPEDAVRRARRILEEIRKKLGNLTPQQEKDYLERLLNFE